MSVIFSPSCNLFDLFFATTAATVSSTPSKSIISTSTLTTMATTASTILIVPRISGKFHTAVLCLKTGTRWCPVVEQYIVGTADGGWISVKVSGESFLNVDYECSITLGVTTDEYNHGQVWLLCLVHSNVDFLFVCTIRVLYKGADAALASVRFPAKILEQFHQSIEFF